MVNNRFCKNAAGIIAAAMIFAICAGRVFAESPAESLQLSIFSESDGRVYGALGDANWYTKVQFDSDTAISVKAAGDISRIYIIWDKTSEPWLLTAFADGRKTGRLYGRDGFLHELAEPEKPCREVFINAPAGSVICDIYAYGEGELPAQVQDWEPPCEDADLLLLSTHGDDEHLFFGGALPTYAGELGYKVQVAYLTNHSGEPYRAHEILYGLWAAGVRNYPVISTFDDYYADSLEQAEKLWDINEVFSYSVMLLRHFKPEVVLGHDAKGEYGHGAHMLGSRALQQAVSWAADPGWKGAGDGIYARAANSLEPYSIKKLYLHLWPENPIRMDWFKPLAGFGGKTAFDVAVEAYGWHKSQHRWFQMGTKGVFDTEAFGLYHSAVGPDKTSEDGDFFENIAEEDFSDYKAPEPEQPEAREEQEEAARESHFAERVLNMAAKHKFGLTAAAVMIALVAVLAAYARRKKD